MTKSTKICVTDKTGEQVSRHFITSVFEKVRATIGNVILATEKVTDNKSLTATEKMVAITHGSSSLGIPNGGWTNFVSDSARAWGANLSLKIATFELLQGQYERLELDIQANGTHTKDFVVQVVPTVKKLRVNCLPCFESFVTETRLDSSQYYANAYAFAVQCDYCGKNCDAGKGVLVTVQYHVLTPKSDVERACECPAMSLRGYVGIGADMYPDRIVQAILTTRHQSAQLVNEYGSKALQPVKAQQQHDYAVTTAQNIWTGGTIQRDKQLVASLTL